MNQYFDVRHFLSMSYYLYYTFTEIQYLNTFATSYLRKKKNSFIMLSSDVSRDAASTGAVTAPESENTL